MRLSWKRLAETHSAGHTSEPARRDQKREVELSSHALLDGLSCC